MTKKIQQLKRINKMVRYILSSIILGTLFIILSFFVRNFLAGLQLSSELLLYVQYYLFWLLIGIVIIISLQALKHLYTKRIFELIVCIIVCVLFFVILSLRLNSSYEGIIVWYAVAGVATGILIFLINQLIMKVRWW